MKCIKKVFAAVWWKLNEDYNVSEELSNVMWSFSNHVATVPSSGKDSQTRLVRDDGRNGNKLNKILSHFIHSSPVSALVWAGVWEYRAWGRNTVGWYACPFKGTHSHNQTSLWEMEENHAATGQSPHLSSGSNRGPEAVRQHHYPLCPVTMSEKIKRTKEDS